MGRPLSELRMYRFVHGEMSQTELGRLLGGKSRQAIAQLEAGKVTPDLKTAYKLSKMLGVSIEELFFPDKEA